MRDAIKNFPRQFAYEPKVENAARLKPFKKYIIVGMGGSHLAADLLKIVYPSLDVYVHKDYGLPMLPRRELEKRLIILSSYSGNTEEVLDAFRTAKILKLSRAVISVGGKLLTLARKEKIPYIKLPDTGIQPRSATGSSFKALIKLMGDTVLLEETKKLTHALDSRGYEKKGRVLAEKLRGHIPLIYTSTRNAPVGYNWKIKFNETAKIPAFCNVFPELNHNEMTGFDVIHATKELSKQFYCILLRDKEDGAKIRRRMDVLRRVYQRRGLSVLTVDLRGTALKKIFSALMLADWTAYYLGEQYGVETEKVPMVEEFKKLTA